jgi:hypothetical protein
MAIEQVIRPYELLVRWDRNGNISGAHRIDRNYLIDDQGRVLGESPMNAIPLELANLPSDPIMSDIAASAVATMNDLNAQMETLRIEKEEAEEKAGAMITENEALQKTVVTAARSIEALQIQVAELQEMIKALEAENLKLQPEVTA